MVLKIFDGFHYRTVELFNQFSFELRYDSLASTFNFLFYFNPLNEAHRELACVSHYHEAIVEFEGETVVTGYVITQKFRNEATKKLSEIAGYARPGILEDSSMPIDLYPLQYNGLTLSQIAKRLSERFRLEMVVDPLVQKEMDKVYPEITASPTQSVKDFLSELAVQRNIIITHDEFGRILFTRAKADMVPSIYLDQDIPGVAMELTFNGQAIHSHITVMKQADSDGGNAGQFTIRNPYVPIARIQRPTTIVQTSGDDNDTEAAAKAALAAELKNIKLVINTDRWKVNGKLIRPNTVVAVKNMEVFLFRETHWFVEAVSYQGDESKTTATLTCVPVEVYNGKSPKNIFVDPHENFPRL